MAAEVKTNTPEIEDGTDFLESFKGLFDKPDDTSNDGAFLDLDATADPTAEQTSDVDAQSTLTTPLSTTPTPAGPVSEEKAEQGSQEKDSDEKKDSLLNKFHSGLRNFFKQEVGEDDEELVKLSKELLNIAIELNLKFAETVSTLVVSGLTKITQGNTKEGVKDVKQGEESQLIEASQKNDLAVTVNINSLEKQEKSLKDEPYAVSLSTPESTLEIQGPEAGLDLLDSNDMQPLEDSLPEDSAENSELTLEEKIKEHPENIVADTFEALVWDEIPEENQSAENREKEESENRDEQKIQP